jgi:hypothetical protein
MPGGKKARISAEEYVEDALRHVEHVTAGVRKTMKVLREPAEPGKGGGHIFGKGCEVVAERIPPPYGGGCG